MSLIWATRGRTWGFRFLRKGDLLDPLPEYDKAFSGAAGDPEICRRVGDKLALRFPDPLKRKDRAGRIIPHEFVIPAPLANQIDSVEEGRQLVWPLVAEQFARDWDLPKPPSAT
jgi:hypothetical protein